MEGALSGDSGTLSRSPDQQAEDTEVGESWSSMIEQLAGEDETELMPPFPQSPIRTSPLRRLLPRTDFVLAMSLPIPPAEPQLLEEYLEVLPNPSISPDQDIHESELPDESESSLDPNTGHVPPPPPTSSNVESIAVAWHVQESAPADRVFAQSAISKGSPTRDEATAAQDTQTPYRRNGEVLVASTTPLFTKEMDPSIAESHLAGAAEESDRPAPLVRDRLPDPPPFQPRINEDRSSARPVMAIRLSGGQSSASITLSAEAGAQVPEAPRPVAPVRGGKVQHRQVLGSIGLSSTSVTTSWGQSEPSETAMTEPAEGETVSPDVAQRFRPPAEIATSAPVRPVQDELEPLRTEDTPGGNSDESSGVEPHTPALHEVTAHSKLRQEASAGREMPGALQVSEPSASNAGRYAVADPRRPFEQSASARPPRTEAVSVPAHRVVEAPERPVNPAAPNEIRLQLDLPEAQPLHVRFVERGGEVHVIVRSNEPGASTRLASGLDEFHRSIETGGSRAETWLAAPETVEPAATSSERFLRDDNESQERPASAEQDRTANKSNSNSHQKGGRAMPDWLELLAEREDETALRRFQNGRNA